MTVAELMQKIQAKALHLADGSSQIHAFYAGDFLSRVMGKAPSGCAWFTVMANVNAAGVAVLAEIGVIVLCEGVEPDPLLTEKCRSEGISLLQTPLSVYACCHAV